MLQRHYWTAINLRKPMQSNYNVDYELNGKTFTQTKVYSSDPGTAMAEIQNRFPGCRLIKAWIEGFWQGQSGGYQEWDAPSVQRPLFHEPRRTNVAKRSKLG